MFFKQIKKNKVSAYLFLTGFLLFNILPAVSFATLGDKNDSVSSLIKIFNSWIGYVFGILMGVALIVFFWGIVKFISAAGDEKKREESKWLLVYGIVGLFIIVSMVGLVALAGALIGISPGGTIDLPSGGYISYDNPANSPVWKPVIADFKSGAEACDPNTPLGSFKNFACFIVYYLSLIPALLVGLAMIYFAWGIVKFIQVGSGNTEEKSSAKKAVIYGLLALFVMTSIWSLVWLFRVLLGF